MLSLIPVVLSALGAAMALFTVAMKLLARHDLSRALAGTSMDRKAELRNRLDTGDVGGAIAIISAHLDQLPPRERVQAAAALTQVSETGRRIYAQTVAASGLRA